MEDVAAAFDVILHKGVIGETYNIGTQKVRWTHAHACMHACLRACTPSQAQVGGCLPTGMLAWS